METNKNKEKKDSILKKNCGHANETESKQNVNDLRIYLGWRILIIGFSHDIPGLEKLILVTTRQWAFN